MKKKLFIGFMALLFLFSFGVVLFEKLEAGGQYHVIHRANRYWKNSGIFSTDNRIQSYGTNNALRIALSNSIYAEFSIDSDGELDLDSPLYLNYAPTGTSGFNLIEVDYDVEGIVTDSARGIYAHVTNRSDTAITGELTGGEFKVRSQDSDTTSVKGIHVSIDAKANTITTGRGIEISIDAGESEHGGITTAQGLRVAHNSSGSHTTIQGIIVEGPGTWTDGVALAGTFTDGIDMSSGTCTTDLKLSNGALIHNTSADILTITEALTSVVGKLDVTHAAVPDGEYAFEIDATTLTGTDSNGRCAYLHNTIEGTISGGLEINTGIWVDIMGSGAITGSNHIRALDVGIYADSDTTLTSTHLIGISVDFQIDDNSSPDVIYPLYFNCLDVGSRTPTAWFRATNQSAIAATISTETMDTNQVGSILIDIAGTNYRIPLVAE